MPDRDAAWRGAAQAGTARRDHLAYTLMLAVPFEIQKLKLDPDRDGVIMCWAKDAAEAVGHRGDALMYKSERGKTAWVFGHLVRGVAAASFQPGGILLFGVLFCARHHPFGVEVEAHSGPCADCVADPAPTEPPEPERPVTPARRHYEVVVSDLLNYVVDDQS